MSAFSPMPKLELASRFTRFFLPSAAERVECVLSDEEASLVARLRNEEPLAVDALYRAHHVALRAFALRLVGEEALAEDLVHDVFLEVPRLMRRFRGQSSLRSFLVGVAANLGGRYIRAASRRRAAMARLAHESPAAVQDDLHEQRERLVLLQRALDRLSIAQRTAFVLCEVEGRSAAEVAEVLGMPEATVRTRCFHARKKVMAALQRVEGGER